MPEPLIILGRSVRAAAQSAIRAGFEPWCIGLVVDRDLEAIARVRTCPPDQFPSGMLAMLSESPIAASVLLTADMENHGEVLDAIAFQRPLLLTKAAAIRAARRPAALSSMKPFKGLRFCDTRTASSFVHRLSRLVFGIWSRKRYLIKPRASSGGAGIEWWTPGQRIDADHYIQQHVRGTSYSCVFTADGWSAILLGVTEQLIGETAFGGDGFWYGGSVGPIEMSESARAALSHLGVQLTQRLDLRGVFGVDMVMDWRGNIWPVEVNPRYTESVEVLERAAGLGLLSASGASARKTGRGRAHLVHGRAVVRARGPLDAPDLYGQLERDLVADVPEVGRPIDAGERICTVFAAAPSRDACIEQLQGLAAKVYEITT